ncbi:hypothetical protein [Enterobacter phage vB_ExiM_F5M1E]|nr:hypothetical protein [Enterobacter phage vB_ExiM_F1M1E]UNA03233.1 hypothetical protein [Enterobacter phage vB_ExiM_F2M1E]UNA03553.1 hypothetical protein [Enterobacter phage vB_ExiM_F4M1E]UNA03874.1 hypothetical protein [Enterobacter phage vB_ExiM_F5M1E]UNA04194.1 hypothetical protein [Pantoea phage vB_PdiM_F5M2A]
MFKVRFSSLLLQELTGLSRLASTLYLLYVLGVVSRPDQET